MYCPYCLEPTALEGRFVPQHDEDVLVGIRYRCLVCDTVVISYETDVHTAASWEIGQDVEQFVARMVGA